MFEGEKTWVFWAGLIILTLAALGLFCGIWFMLIVPGGLFAGWQIFVPYTVAGIVFILIGLYMMKSGTRRERQPGTAV